MLQGGDLLEYERLLARVRALAMPALPPPERWDHVAIDYGQVGEWEVCSALQLFGYGYAEDLPAPAELLVPMRELRQLLVHPERGAPIGLTFHLSSEVPGLGLDLNLADRLIYDDAGRPAYTAALPEALVRPTREDWRRELQDHPRTPQNVPAWWAALIGGGPGDALPAMPSWFGGPMPQTLADAEAATRVVVPKFQSLLNVEGYARIVDPLVARIHELARMRGTETLDAIFGRSGLAAQTAAQRDLAREAVAEIEPQIASLTPDQAAEVVAYWHGNSRDGGPDADQQPAVQLRVAVERFAARVVARRFGALPKNWYLP